MSKIKVEVNREAAELFYTVVRKALQEAVVMKS